MKTTLSVLLFFLAALFFLDSCSQVVPPVGGKKDTLAPVLTESLPINRQKNFKGQIIELTFNEDIRLDNPNQKIIITPQPDEIFRVKARPNSFRILFEKPLKDSTTYTLNFTDAVKDVNEGNPALNLKLVFSTGNLIDSLRVRGNVVDLQTGLPVLNTLVGLYIPSDTLTPTRIKPYFFTRTDTSGNFNLENIRSGTYRVFAFDDKNLNLLYNPGVERVAFLRDSLVVNRNVDTLKFELFPYYNTPPRVSRTEQRASSYTLVFDRGLTDYRTQFANPADSLPSFLRTPSELTFFNTSSSTDTIRVQINALDSLGNTATLNQGIRFRQASRQEKPVALEARVQPGTGDDIERNAKFVIQFSKPVARTTPDSIRLFTDSLTLVPLAAENFVWSNSRTQLTITKSTPARQSIRFMLGKGAFISIQNDSTAAARYQYALRNPENYGVLFGQINTTEPKFIVELLNENFKVVDRQFNTPTYRFTYVKPGKYRLRVILDKNGNGKWDSGNLPERQLPEPIIHYPTVIPLKQNFEYSQDINTL
ncbi:Ig-like domain-containing domain [Tellurirhabdus rosea]|uniref:Ig-like domain-containing domain n=1 Tax=Tellurirhabdus rosea TaxID=2674997 RepID=UPI002250E864|nr:Ig-like domain-containing domain [Tellurirhabdus rosea]